MNTWVKVVRYHLVDRFTFVGYPWAILAFVFLINLAIFASVAPPASQHGQSYSGALAAIYIVFGIVGSRAVSSRLPFALALGVSRRSFYTGTALLAAGLAAANALALTVLQIIERATGGWGMRLHFFRVPFLLAGPWYLTLPTSFVALAVMFAWGMWFGLIYQRWNLAGLTAFVAAQITVVTIALVIAFQAHIWPGVGRFFTVLSIGGLTGALAVLAMLLLAGGYATIRRVAV
ncbi:MAG TPA: hypothetical protein VHY58_07890 [Streptosporangiaceae bacterium]|jgi:hypothetical protein|nr:hypothetical protein [Streptosporangiaceae bacterium]